ncbi:hypothetical protein E3T55_02025 [Cryobacterium frigoriphilum]|uniref:DUF8094 domain-containing protein n=1 Tax=Cryobacterium frigoriphilum TaxID=1259150 RepID=A0A4R9AAA7_9MICO|nr:hypothetical protein [Cryobacterium frigoriphilum]TFD55215.1 hypothetical protein E3T55_02025 [Cryobacterium frigoriphilum]
MRFVFAIVAFVLAAAMIVLGLAQRTVFLEPDSISLSTTVSGEAAYTVIDPSALAAHSGRQTVSISGADEVFMAFGRSADVDAWIGTDAHSDVSLVDGQLVSTETAATTDETETDSESAETTEVVDEPVTSPVGSDLWLDEFSADRQLVSAINVPEGISLIVASDGVKAAPGEISLSWRVDNGTPWAGPLILGGAVLLLIGLVLYLLALLHLRRSRGPRRNVPRPRLPRLPRPPRPRALKASEITGPRKSINKFVAVVPMLAISGLVLSGCSAEFWPGGAAPVSGSSATASPTPASTDEPEVSTAPAPAAVTVPQLERIVAKISKLTAEADAGLDSDALSARFAGPALEQRLANYQIRTVAPEVTASAAIPATPLVLTLPQQTESWPRTVMTVIQDADSTSVAPTALVLSQETPRDNYLVEYAVQLEPESRVDVAPAVVGAPLIAPDSRLLLLPPDQIAAAYADILAQGEASPSFGSFDATGDSFRSQVAERRATAILELPDTAGIEYTTAGGSGRTLALATNDSGSVVAVSLNEVETVRPVADQAVVGPKEGSVSSRALSGIDESTKGLQSTYADQLLFYVPAAGSDAKISLLGFSQGLISSAELP